MKSRISWSKLAWQEWKRQAWVFAGACFLFFLIWPVYQLMRINNWEQYSPAERTEQFRQCFQSGSFFSLMPLGIVILAAVCAWSGFLYLHRKDQADFFHALPVRRERYFCIRVFCALTDYLLPAAASMLLSVLVSLPGHLFQAEDWGLLVKFYLAGLAAFLYCYAAAVLAMQLTGNLLTGILGTGVLYIFTAAVYVVHNEYCRTFFTTYYSSGLPARKLFLGGIESLQILSPVMVAVKAAPAVGTADPATPLLVSVILAVLILAGSLILYRLRPLEAAGKAMAFFRAGEGIKIILTIFGALCTGLFFVSSMDYHLAAWFVFGLILGLVMFYTIIQMIYCLDIRRLLRNRISLALAVAGTAALAAVYAFDLTGFDGRVPAAGEIESIGMVMDYANCPGGQLDLEDQVRMQKIACDEELHSLLQTLAVRTREYKGWKDRSMDESPNWVTPLACIRLKNGRELWRRYDCPMEDSIKEGLLHLYEEPSYLDGTFMARLLSPDDITAIEVVRMQMEPLADTEGYSYDQQRIPIESEEDRNALAEALIHDMQHVSRQTAESESPAGILTYRFDIRSYGPFAQTDLLDLKNQLEQMPDESVKTAMAETMQQVYIYPSFTETIKELKRLHISWEMIPEDSRITELVLYQQYGDDPDSESPEPGERITDPARLKELRTRFVPENLWTIWQTAAWRAEIAWQSPEGDGLLYGFVKR